KMVILCLALLVFGIGYNALISYAERQGYLSGFTWTAVVLGVAVTVAGVAAAFWSVALPGWQYGLVSWAHLHPAAHRWLSARWCGTSAPGMMTRLPCGWRR
ncbi:MAG TPA: hypothetical protein PKH19_02320, partial [Candidatus Syntrophosphaera sp.]|nr:hypothetical protein [Candidatus Syntrophosphaera sp.]